jgi:hypothetical protein
MSTATASQLEANRRNALRSTGPVTNTGKISSSRNAVSHGLTSKHPVLPSESAAEYQQHLDSYVDVYRPIGFEQTQMVAELADLRWRLRRVPTHEAGLYAIEITRMLQENSDSTKGLTAEQLQAMAFARLTERRILPNLFAQESRLSRRADRLHKRLSESRQESAPLDSQTQQPEIVKNEPKPLPPPPIAISTKVGRNEPCPCGSSLKFKRCCGNPLASMRLPVLNSQAA